MKVIVFDFDGTIADSLILGLQGVNLLAEKYNYQPITDTDYIRSKGMRRIIKEDLHLKWYQLPFYVQALKKVLIPKIDELQLFDGVPELIRGMSDDYQLFIMTSNIRKAVEHALTKYQLQVFDDVFAGIPTFRKHFTLKKLIQRQHISPKDIIYVGDEVRDVEACKRAGIPIIGVTWGLNDRTALEAAGANFIVDTPVELLNQIQQLTPSNQPEL